MNALTTLPRRSSGEATERDFAGEWFHTKDAASQDEDGYIWYEGRADDVIITAGYRLRSSSCWRSSMRRILPVSVLGSESVNSISRG